MIAFVLPSPTTRDQQREKGEGRYRVQESGDGDRERVDARAAGGDDADGQGDHGRDCKRGQHDRDVLPERHGNLVPVTQEPRHAGVAANRATGDGSGNRIDIGAERPILIEHRDDLAHACKCCTRSCSERVGGNLAQIDRLCCHEQLDRDEIAKAFEHIGEPFDAAERHRRVILGAFRYGEEIQRRRIGPQPNLGPQRRDCLLQRGETGVRRSAARQLQRQIGERRRHEADHAFGTQACRLRDGDRGCVERDGECRHVKIAVRQHDAVRGDHQRTFRGAGELDLDQFTYGAQRRLQRALHLRDDAEAERILHAARRPGREQRAAGEQRAQLCRSLDLPRRRPGTDSALVQR